MLTQINTHAGNGVSHTAAARNGRTQPQPPEAGRHEAAKRCFDAVLALLLLIVSAPIQMLVILVVKLTSAGPAIYSQTRLGRNARPYKIFKIRTMYHDCERHSGPRWSTPGDPRVTAVGRFLRRTHLDELPQLWNVLRGEMSLVGPRPERPEFVKLLECAVPHYHDRLLVRPGVTGLAQVMLPADTDLASVRRKLAHDLCYVRRQSLWLDVRIMACTAFNLVGVELSGVLRLPRPEPGKPLPESSLLDRRRAERRTLAVPVPSDRRSGHDRRHANGALSPLAVPNSVSASPADSNGAAVAGSRAAN